MRHAARQPWMALVVLMLCWLAPDLCLPSLSLLPSRISVHSRAFGTLPAFCGPYGPWHREERRVTCAQTQRAMWSMRERMDVDASKAFNSAARVGGPMSQRAASQRYAGAEETTAEGGRAADPHDPAEAMRKWSKLSQSTLGSGGKRINDLKMKTMQALDNLFSGGFMQEQEDQTNEMLPVLRKYLMNDFEGYAPPSVTIAPALRQDFENFGAPQALTAPSLNDRGEVAGGLGLTRGETSDSDPQRALKGMLSQHAGLWTLLRDDGKDVLSLDREMFRGAVQSGLGSMAAEDIDLVFDDIDKDGDGALTLEELYETYKTVEAEIVTEQDMMSLRDFDQLDIAKLRPDRPDAAFSSVLPAGVQGGTEAVGRDAAVAARIAAWEPVCQVLATQVNYLPDAGREMVEEAVALTSQLLLASDSETERSSGEASFSQQIGGRMSVGGFVVADYGQEAGQVRATRTKDDGDTDFGDGLALGGIVAGLQSQSEAVAAAVLLPAFRCGLLTVLEARQRFGPVVATILEDALWLSNLPETVGLMDDDGSRFLREYMVAVSRDHRAVIVMLADRLHNLRRAGAAPMYQQHLRALEALHVYSPLAHALGVGKWLWELEDLSFRALFPDSYSDVEVWQLDLWSESSAMMEQAKSEVLACLNENAVLLANVERYTISTRRKSIFSTFKKMYQKNKNLEGIKDIFAMRIVIGLHDSARQDGDMQARVCLEAYSSLRKALPSYVEGPGRFKDYATNPKANGYQSVHTTLTTPTGLPLEIQIRTEEMHAAAEFGDASHNLYKGGIKSLSSAQKFADSVRKANVAVLSSDKRASTPAAGHGGDGEDEELRSDQALIGPGRGRSGHNGGAGKPVARMQKRPPSLKSVIRQRGLGGGGDGRGKMAAGVGGGSGEQCSGERPKMMTAPCIATDDMPGEEGEDAWLGESIGEDLVAVSKPAPIVRVSAEGAADGDHMPGRKPAMLQGWDGGWSAGGAAEEMEQRSMSLSVVLGELETRAWREAQLAPDSPAPETPAEEARVRQQLRQQGEALMKSQQDLRLLLDSTAPLQWPTTTDGGSRGAADSSELK